MHGDNTACDIASSTSAMSGARVGRLEWFFARKRYDTAHRIYWLQLSPSSLRLARATVHDDGPVRKVPAHGRSGILAGSGGDSWGCVLRRALARETCTLEPNLGTCRLCLLVIWRRPNRNLWLLSAFWRRTSCSVRSREFQRCDIHRSHRRATMCHSEPAVPSVGPSRSSKPVIVRTCGLALEGMAVGDVIEADTAVLGTA